MKKLFIILLLFVFGCAPAVVLRPIEKSDIFRIKKGECNAEKDGWFISDFYLKEVMQAKIE